MLNFFIYGKYVRCGATQCISEQCQIKSPRHINRAKSETSDFFIRFEFAVQCCRATFITLDIMMIRFCSIWIKTMRWCIVILKRNMFCTQYSSHKLDNRLLLHQQNQKSWKFSRNLRFASLKVASLTTNLRHCDLWILSKASTT